MRVIVLLDDGTTGEIISLNDWKELLVTVELFDENGNIITKTGKVAEVLDHD